MVSCYHCCPASPISAFLLVFLIIFSLQHSQFPLLPIECIPFSPPPLSLLHSVSVFCPGVETIPSLLGRKRLVGNLNNCASQIPSSWTLCEGEKKGLCTKTGFNGPLSVCFRRIRSILTSSGLSA